MNPEPVKNTSTNCGDLIQRLVNAIFRQEGMPPTYTNPGNLRDCPWFIKVAGGVRVYATELDGTAEPVQYAKGFWLPRTRAEGVAGAAHVVSLHIAQGDSLRKMIGIWAPPKENDTEAYIKNVTAWANIPNSDVPLWNFIQDVPVAEKVS